MRVVSLVSSKGGSGKSTLCAHLAAAAAGTGEIVVAIDTDPQESFAKWGGRREAEDIAHRAVEPAGLEDLIRRVREHGATTLCVIDTAGIAGPGAVLAARQADLTLVPVKATRTDLDAVRVTADALGRAGIRFAFVVTQVPGAALDRAREAAKDLVRLGRVAPIFTGHRVGYDDAMGLGQGITEADPTSKGADEIKALWTWIASEIKRK